MDSTLSELALCAPVDGSLAGSSIRGILQARILEWVAISFSNPNLCPDHFLGFVSVNVVMVILENVVHPWILAPLSPLLASSEKPEIYPCLSHNPTAHNAPKLTFPLK